jgi:serine/threonine protein kinase
MADQFDREKEIFEHALDLASREERRRFLESACGGDTALLGRVRALLQADEQGEEFLPEHPKDTVHLITEKPGDTIGRYKLLQQIGEGGCGVVYMAEQSEPVRRRVALKVIKLGMDTKSVIVRFEAERQALALMDHPNIAKVFDAGSTETGRPYFVMELVRGIKITDYCDQNNLSTQDRLKLFAQVCQAIQHAHQKGVIHRDIKPSNILVTVNDSAPVPKIIDFGIAKATSQQLLTDKTLFTAFEQFIGTPAYMSPEQAVMTSLDIDTRSDIYSLGVLLYELLTSKTPFDANELVKAGLDEIRRTIREQEPPKPSTRLGTMLQRELTETAKHRQSEAPKLIHLLRGDLDWIVMKALEKDRTRRYETANGLARDVQRYLDNEPITARPPSRLYRIQKLVRRNKLAVAAASAVAAALVIGLGVSTWMFIKEKAARERAVAAEKDQTRLRQQAQTEAAKSQQVSRFLQEMLAGVSPWTAKGQDTALLRDILDKSAERIGNDLTNQPLVEAELRDTLGSVYFSLGLWDKSEAMFRQALAIQKRVLGNEHPDIATSLEGLGVALTYESRMEEAGILLRDALAMRRKLLGDEHQLVAQSLDLLAKQLRSEGKLNEAENVAREHLALQRKRTGNESADVARSLYSLSKILLFRGKVAEADPIVRESLAMQKKLMPDDLGFIGWTLIDAASLYENQGDLAEAEATLREALAMHRKFFGNEHSEVAGTLDCLARTLQKQNRFSEAEACWRESVVITKKQKADSRLPRFTASLAEVLRKQNKPSEARPFVEEAIALYQRHSGQFASWQIEAAFQTLKDILSQLGDTAALEAMETQRLDTLRAGFPSSVPALVTELANRAGVLRKKDKPREARALAQEAFDLCKKYQGRVESWRQFGAFESLRDALSAVGETSALEDVAVQHVQNLRAAPIHENSWLAVGLADLSSIMRKNGKLAKARPLAEEAVMICQRHDEPVERWVQDRAFNALKEILKGLGDTSAVENLELERRVEANRKPIRPSASPAR